MDEEKLEFVLSRCYKGNEVIDYIKNKQELIDYLNGVVIKLHNTANDLAKENAVLRKSVRTLIPRVDCRADVGFNCEGMTCSKCYYRHESEDSIIEYIISKSKKETNIDVEINI